MGYKVNPLGTEELRQLALQRIGVPAFKDRNTLTAQELGALLEEVAISKVEVEIQNEHLQETCARLDVALTEANELYNFAPIGIISTDLDGKITRLNLTAAKLLGQERHRLVGHRFINLFVVGQRASIQTLMQQASLSGEDVQHELVLDKKAKALRHVKLSLSPLAGRQGFQMVLVNIATRKLAPQDQRSIEDRWRRAFDALGDGTWDWNVQSGEVRYSARLAKLYGCAAEQFGSTLEAWRLRVHPLDWGALLVAMQRCLRGPDTRFSNIHRGRCMDGQWKWIECQGVVLGRDEDGLVTRVIGTHTDVSERKRMEEELQDMTGLQQAVFEAVPQYLAVLDGAGQVLKTNAVWNAYALAHGRAYHNGFAGRPYVELLNAVTGGVEETKRAVMAGIAEVVSGKAPRFQMEYSFQARVDVRWFVLNVVSVQEGLAHAVVSHQDVSRYRKPLPKPGVFDYAQGYVVKGLDG